MDDLFGHPPPPYQPERLPGRRDALGYALFLAGFPDPADASTLCDGGKQQAHEHGLRNAVQVPRLAHVTLFKLDKHDPLDTRVHDAVRAAASQVSCEPLPIVFNRARSVAADGAFMLLCDEATNARVAQLRQPLGAALRRFGLRPGEIATPQ